MSSDFYAVVCIQATPIVVICNVIGRMWRVQLTVKRPAVFFKSVALIKMAWGGGEEWQQDLKIMAEKEVREEVRKEMKVRKVERKEKMRIYLLTAIG